MVESGTLIDDDQEGDGKYIGIFLIIEVTFFFLYVVAPEVFEPNYIATPKFDIFSLALCIVEISTGEQVRNIQTKKNVWLSITNYF